MSKALAVAITCLAGLALGGPGCSGSTTVSPDQGCSDLSAALCNKLDACSALLVQIAYGDSTTCATRSKTSCTAGLSASGTGITPSYLEGCAQAVGGASCEDLLSGITPDACKPVMGSVANGAACGDNSQCQSTYCNRGGVVVGQSATCGTCAPQPAAGAACKVNNDCPSGSKCNAVGACATLGAAGASCDATHPCLTTLVCKGGACATPDAAGQPCVAQPDSCDLIHGAVCNPLTKICAMVQTATAGQTCGLGGNTLTVCTGGASCKLAGASGTCQAPAADGASCDLAQGPQCLAPATCTNGVCTLPDPASCK